MPQLSERDVARFTHVDHDDRVAFVLTVAGADDRGRPLRRRLDGAGARPRSRSWSRTATRAAASRQLLLEHLAQAGRERGIDRFVAEVLPENQPDDPDLPRRRLPASTAATRTA